MLLSTVERQPKLVLTDHKTLCLFSSSSSSREMFQLMPKTFRISMTFMNLELSL